MNAPRPRRRAARSSAQSPVAAPRSTASGSGVDRQRRAHPLAPAPVESVRRTIRELTQSTYEEAILDSAERVFAKVGYAQAKMADLARATGVSVGTLYNYFESKQTVFQAIMRRNIRSLIAALESVDTSGDPVARLEALLDRTLRHAEAHSPLFLLFMQLGGVSEIDIGRILGEQCEAGYVHALGIATATIRDAVERGELRKDVEAESLATFLGGMVNAAIFAWLRRGRDGSLMNRSDEIMKTFLQGARAR
jgi:AcrR family transcriptional regulator